MDEGVAKGSTTPSRTVTFRPEADWAFDHVLESLCDLALAVTLVPVDGREVDAVLVLVAVVCGVLTCEGWDKGAASPTARSTR